MSPRLGGDTARALRREFDGGFAAAPPGDRERLEAMLAIRVAGDPYAIALADISGLRSWRVVPVPSDAPDLLGIAGNRGAVVPVYDLAALLGYPRQHTAAWIMTTASLALAFERLDGHVHVSQSSVSSPDGASAYLPRSLTLDGALRPIIQIKAVADFIVRRGHDGPAREP